MRGNDEVITEIRNLMSVRASVRPGAIGDAAVIDGMIRVLMTEMSEDEIQLIYSDECTRHFALRTREWLGGAGGENSSPSADWVNSQLETRKVA